MDLPTLFVACAYIVVAFMHSGAAGPVPLPSWANPVADPKAQVTVDGLRVTVLTDALVRIEYREGGQPFEDRPTIAVWNRKLPVPAFDHTQLDAHNHVINTSSLTLLYDAREGYSSSNPRIRISRPAFWSNDTEWNPSKSSAGNLFGTFHTLDTLGGWQDMNCSHASAWGADGPRAHCSMGLISKSGWATLDDARRPLMNDGWFHPQMAGTCPATNSTEPLAPCFPQSSLPPFTEESCQQAGCCWANTHAVVKLNLYYSGLRKDHFTDPTCAGCAGLYKMVRTQGYTVNSSPSPNQPLIPLNLYWSADAEDNVVSTIPPAQPGYSFVRVVGYIFAANSTDLPDNTTSVDLWYNEDFKDHFTTATQDGVNEAKAANYTHVAQLGFMFDVNSPPTNSGALVPPCYQRRGNVDTYFFGHGMDYAGALRDYSKIGGKIPLPRRHFLGMSWSKWGNQLTQDITYQQVYAMGNMSLPLDTFIFDMNWHLKPHWTGYTWDTNQYPDHVSLLDWLHTKGLQMALNLHDAEGVLSFEKRYAAMAQANGIDPSSGQTVEFHISNFTYADSLHKIVLGPLAEEGIDFWWTDWQQGLKGANDVCGLNPTIVLNHYRFMNYTGSARRGLFHSRYGGWGNHRYATGFGGDVQQSWDSLSFMIYFTQTATNVLFGWWGHEMMSAGDPELFTRVIQFGSWSPVYTNWGNNGSDDNLWQLQEPFYSAVQQTLVMRSRTLPLRYTLGREAHDTGLSTLRPMYYHYPTDPNAYNATTQYLMGPDLIVAPASCARTKSTGTSPVLLYFPESEDWMAFNTTKRPSTSGWTTVQAAINEVPVFARRGSIIPTKPEHLANQFASAAKVLTHVELAIHSPLTGSSGSLAPINGSASLYDDDGISDDYLETGYSNTSASMTATTNGITLRMDVSGSFTGKPSQRRFDVTLLDTARISSVAGGSADKPSKPFSKCSQWPPNKDTLPCWASTADDRTSVAFIWDETVDGSSIFVSFVI